jgi:hypothetical protein
MTREPVSLAVVDVSAFAKSLKASLQAADDIPGHLGFLNLIARAAGFRNYQHLRAFKRPPPPAYSKPVKRALRVFDDAGRMHYWPAGTALQGLCLWAIWAHMPGGRDLTEKQVNAVINTWHNFGDHAQVRRAMIENHQLKRTVDGAIYRKIDDGPPADATTLIAALNAP